jgi:hypothetical protein
LIWIIYLQAELGYVGAIADNRRKFDKEKTSNVIPASIYQK